jgi:hypothetical protein
LLGEVPGGGTLFLYIFLYMVFTFILAMPILNTFWFNDQTSHQV